MNFNKNNFAKSLRNFFQYRYGSDSLNVFLVVVALIISNIPYVFLLSYLLIGFSVFRMLSKNIYKRQRELNKYNNVIGYRLIKLLRKIGYVVFSAYGFLRTKIKKFKNRNEEKKHYIFFKCKNCHNTLKVPKDKGKIKVTCPVCKTQVSKKT